MTNFVELIYPDLREKRLSAEPADPIFLFLWDLKNAKMKTTILAELGRLTVRAGDDVALKAARVICENKMNTTQALAYLRRFRKTKTAQSWAVLTKILRLIDNSLLDEKEIAMLLENLNFCLSPENNEGE